MIFGYLFGSHAAGDAAPDSDLDIALFLRDDSLDVRLGLIHRLQKELKKEIDLVVLSDIKNIFLLMDSNFAVSSRSPGRRV